MGNNVTADANPKNEALFAAISKGSVYQVRDALENGGDVKGMSVCLCVCVCVSFFISSLILISRYDHSL
jgi:mannitol-specific phosphotransferase system IIBC component